MLRGARRFLTTGTPVPVQAGLSVIDAVAMLVGVVIGIGIFGFPPLVAQHSVTPAIYMGMWLAGGLTMLAGALCYAELGSTYPDTGGEYAFLARAWGVNVGVLFAWARGTVIQTGAIATVAFIYGDYAQVLLPLGPYGPAIHGAIAVAVLTLLNVAGTVQSKRVQLVLTGATVLALIIVSVTGLTMAGPSAITALPATPAGSMAGNLGMGMVFVLLTYGGWNEAAYLSGELTNPGRNMSRVLIFGTVVVTVVYLIVNLAYLRTFGLDGLRSAQAVGANMMELIAGPRAAIFLSVIVCCTALSTANGCIFTGARVYYSLGRDVPALRSLGAWNMRGSTPVRALFLQGTITLLLILFGVLSRGGIQAMVAYTAPVFWLFMFLIACAVVVLRMRDGSRVRPFSVPWYPLTPVLFATSCLGLFAASVRYAGAGALLGLLVLAAGIPLLWLRKRVQKA